MTIGELIRKYRNNANMSMTELGKRIGVSAAAISRYELGQRDINKDTLESIKNVLNIPDEEITGSRIEKIVLNSGTHVAFSEELIIDAINKSLKLNGISEGMIKSKRLNAAFDSLNAIGQQRAVAAVEDLAKVPEYQRGNKLPADE